MRKTGRIITLMLAVVTIVLSVISAKNHLLRIVSIIIRGGFGPIEKNQLFFNAIYALVAIYAIYFAIIYLVYTLKNGLGTELYIWSKEKHLQYLEARKQKKHQKTEKHKAKLQEKLNKLNNEENE